MMNLAYALIFGFVIAAGLPLNAMSLWILLRHHSLKTPSAVFMVNLAISDLLLIISLPMRVYFYATGMWPLNNMACIWVRMLFRNNIRSSSIFITFISVDRLLAVVYPLRSRYLRTSSKAWKGAALVWLIVVVVNVPESVGFSRFLDEAKIACFEYQNATFSSPAPSGPLNRAIDYFQLVLLFTMLAVNIVSTALVSWTVQRHLHESARVNNKVNVMLIFAMNLMMFTVFFLPVSLVVFFEYYRPALSCLASLNCCLDPLLYYFSFDGFWKRKEDVDTSLARE
ncbi:lysophosphatidic acid receptor 6-like [Melanotaenia boesemani]|uniref:lysophosphatidic acid receptor 6-like n=1 Tax=Melanotaenia boesemani TaxID=1250792 RepID=UPI001C04029C|nr:lysophosphatidic acid receptor 6-like [Melanotaenia boesemani]